MRSVRWAFLGVMVAILILGVPARALAGWPFPDSRSPVMLGFGATYSGVDGGDSTHRGLDISGQAGDSVVAPLDGTVSFIGRVPGTGGGTVLAVTVQTDSGALTLLPLASGAVARGDRLAQGDAVGALADGGDASSQGTHLHVGLKKGSLYLDPGSVLAPPVAQEARADAPQAELGAQAGVVGSGIESVADVANTASGSSVSTRVGVQVEGDGLRSTRMADAGSLVGAGVAAGVQGVSASVAAGAELAPGVTLAAEADGLAGASADRPGIVAETGRAIATGGDIAKAATSAAADGRLGATVSRAVGLARSGARTMALVGVSLLCGLGALWPLWRCRGMGEGLSKVPVSVMTDDVAAVASR